jgi:NCS1 family nucleobase:cation symporter-1
MTAASGDAGRRLNWLDYAALWGFLGASLYIMPFGSLVVPALSIERAVLAVVCASIIAGLLIAVVSSIAARDGSTTLDLLTRVFGTSARTPFLLLLLVRHVIFGALAIAIAADAAELVSDRALGAGVRPVWIVLFAGAGLLLAWLGPEFTISKVMKRFGIWLVIIVAILITISAYLEYEIPTYLKRPAVGGWPSFAQAVDVLLVVPLLYLPVVADHARLARSDRDAARGSFIGLTLATVWFAVLGVLYLPAVEGGDISGFVVSMGLGLGAIVILLLLQTDEIFINLSAAASSFTEVPRRVVVALAVVLAAALAIPFDLVANEGWFLFAGALFVPLFAVVLAGHLPLSRAAAPYAAVVAWLVGFLLYQWISPADLDWWRDVLSEVAGSDGLAFPLEDEVTWLGASVTSFAASFILMTAARLATIVMARLPEEAFT